MSPYPINYKIALPRITPSGTGTACGGWIPRSKYCKSSGLHKGMMAKMAGVFAAAVFLYTLLHSGLLVMLIM